MGTRRPAAANRRRGRRFPAGIAQLVEHLQHALNRFLGLVRMQIGEAGHAGDPFVPLRVVLHRARAERIEVRVDAHVELRQVGEMADDLRLRAARAEQGARRRARRRAATRRRAARARRTAAGGARGGRIRRARTAFLCRGYYALLGQGWFLFCSRLSDLPSALQLSRRFLAWCAFRSQRRGSSRSSSGYH